MAGTNAGQAAGCAGLLHMRCRPPAPCPSPIALLQAWAHVNLQKAVLPRVWALLRHGCYGSAEGSFQAVLPLVTLLPPEALGPSPGFFTSLHTSVWLGLEAVPDAAGRRAAAVCFQVRTDCNTHSLCVQHTQFACVELHADSGIWQCTQPVLAFCFLVFPAAAWQLACQGLYMEAHAAVATVAGDTHRCSLCLPN